MKGFNMMNAQMELGFATPAGCQPIERRQRRLTRAHWWFERMRHIVDRACDWEIAPSPRPEQIWFSGAIRQVEVPLATNQPRGSEEQQVCE